LRHISSANKDNEHLNLNLKSLIFKNAILTVTGSVSTITAYAVWIMVPVSATPLYIDLVVNCLVIGLMSKSNEKHYKRLCRPCIMVCYNYGKQDSATSMEKEIESSKIELRSVSSVASNSGQFED